jgi:ParB/RepB/Spo0J family partition protein
MQAPFVTEDLAISAIGTRYAELRIVRPRADAAMERSMRQFGQLVPVVCVREGSGAQMIDGFKRLGASKRLGLPTVLARIGEETSPRACKAALIQLNQTSKSISSLEEAIVIDSLYRKDGLKQPEIATLFGKDKSWVSRRLSLINKLSEEVRKNMMLGLVSSVAGMELARLQRCNQDETLACVLKHRLAVRDTAKLVSYLLSHPKWENESILRSPWTMLDREPKQRPADLESALLSMRRGCRSVTNTIDMNRTGEAGKLSGLIGETINSAREALSALERFSPKQGEI